ncbi:uridine kinase family protein [Streptomyces boninensis]|uniref:uridine kinase family protein n=1 Tax=Streptomyces boninensis TaxID=2039455 RepID=UPI003B212579
MPARVILLTGPSGSGKSRLAAEAGLPILRLDDFYKEGDDPTLPAMGGGIGTDWDHPASWNAGAAIEAIEELCATGRTDTPLYDISTSSITGHEIFDLKDAPLFVAEGIFAAEIVREVADRGLLADAISLQIGAGRTYRRRLLRDLREGRKAPHVLLLRGWRLMQAEPAITARQVALGAHACSKREALARIAAAKEKIQA